MWREEGETSPVADGAAKIILGIPFSPRPPKTNARIVTSSSLPEHEDINPI